MNLKPEIQTLDNNIITEMRKWSLPALRFSLGVVFIWFGILKPFGQSSAENLL